MGSAVAASATQQPAQLSGCPDAAEVFGSKRPPQGSPDPSGPVERVKQDHHVKAMTEDHWTWHLALLPREQHSFGGRCWSGLLGRRRHAADGTARKVVGR